MVVLKNEYLKSYTTFRMGGPCTTMYFPENLEDLKCLHEMDNTLFEHILGAGSNILISGETSFSGIVCSQRYLEGADEFGDGRFYFPSGYRLSSAIDVINRKGYGGIEYLISVPGTIGGAVLMNAGRGRAFNKSISDYIEFVDVFTDGEVKRIKKADCGFEYRKSCFQSMKGTFILGACFAFECVDCDTSEKLKKERIKLCHDTQDNSSPNMGSIFATFDGGIIDFVKNNVSNDMHVAFSDKTQNWLLNRGGSFDEAMYLINTVKTIHELLNKECELEIKIWG